LLEHLRLDEHVDEHLNLDEHFQLGEHVDEYVDEHGNDHVDHDHHSSRVHPGRRLSVGRGRMRRPSEMPHL
jgi:hypothetical protein